MRAIHADQCHLCGHPIRQGDPIAKVSGAWVHAHCATTRWAE